MQRNRPKPEKRKALFVGGLDDASAERLVSVSMTDDLLLLARFAHGLGEFGASAEMLGKLLLR
jgi:hypothetical protein